MRAGAPLLVGIIVLGAAVRLVGGVPLLQTDLVTAPEASRPMTAVGAPEAAAASFYSFLQSGDYQKAWEVSLEPDWAGSSTAPYGKEIAPSARSLGWTPEADFIRRCQEDIGPGMKLNAVEVERLASAPETPEARAASALGATRLFGVRARGHMLGACLIYRWERDLVVAEVGGRYRVLLPGTKAARASFHQDWFSNLSLIGSLRASGK